jgi:hypothetical protein
VQLHDAPVARLRVGHGKILRDARQELQSGGSRQQLNLLLVDLVQVGCGHGDDPLGCIVRTFIITPSQERLTAHDPSHAASTVARSISRP